MRFIAQLGRAVDAQSLVKAWHKKQQPQTWVVDQIAQTIQPVVATGIGDEQRIGVCGHDEAGLAATG